MRYKSSISIDSSPTIQLARADSPHRYECMHASCKALANTELQVVSKRNVWNILSNTRANHLIMAAPSKNSLCHRQTDACLPSTKLKLEQTTFSSCVLDCQSVNMTKLIIIKTETSMQVGQSKLQQVPRQTCTSEANSTALHPKFDYATPSCACLGNLWFKKANRTTPLAKA